MSSTSPSSDVPMPCSVYLTLSCAASRCWIAAMYSLACESAPVRRPSTVRSAVAMPRLCQKPGGLSEVLLAARRERPDERATAAWLRLALDEAGLLELCDQLLHPHLGYTES